MHAFALQDPSPGRAGSCPMGGRFGANSGSSGGRLPSWILSARCGLRPLPLSHNSIHSSACIPLHSLPRRRRQDGRLPGGQRPGRVVPVWRRPKPPAGGGGAQPGAGEPTAGGSSVGGYNPGQASPRRGGRWEGVRSSRGEVPLPQLLASTADALPPCCRSVPCLFPQPTRRAYL